MLKCFARSWSVYDCCELGKILYQNIELAEMQAEFLAFKISSDVPEGL